ncbi:unnamed protein product [Sympodiomycopsis kandeliae]
MPREIQKSSRTDLLSGSTAPLPSVHPLGQTPLYGPPISQHVVIILGVGPGLGLALAKVFASQGYITVIMSRNLDRLQTWAQELNVIAQRARTQSTQDALSIAVQCDVLSNDSVNSAIDTILRSYPSTKGYRIGTAIYNASIRKKSPFLEQTDEQMSQSVQASVSSAFVFMKRVITEMNRDHTGGNILVTGATSSTRGREGFAAFSAGKTGLRRLCETAAREFGPDGIHVAHVIIDGLIDSDAARRFLLGSDERRRFPDSTVLIPDEMAKSYLFLAQQAPSAWTFEMDLRPAKEHF